MTGAPGTAFECIALAEVFAVKQKRSEVVPHENALCLRDRGFSFFRIILSFNKTVY